MVCNEKYVFKKAWVKMNLAEGKGVKGVIVAKKANEKLKYACSIIPDISRFAYELNFKI